MGRSSGDPPSQPGVSITRRRLLRSAAGAGLTAGLSGLYGSHLAQGDTLGDPDYVVIGSGPGGAPIAANLAEAGHRVLLLEAGPAHGNDNYYRAPALFGRAAEDPAISWDFFVRHYTQTAAHGDQFVPQKHGVLYPRSATLGGCTAHHAMVTVYPEHSDWELIRHLTGDEGWDRDRMWGHWERVRAWQPIENNLPPEVLHDVPLEAVIGSMFAEAAFLPPGNLAVGTDPNARINVDRSAQGVFPIPQATRDGVRVGPRERLLGVARSHPRRLSIATNALVERIVLEKDRGGRMRAVAVEYLEGRHLYAASPLYRRTPGAERRRLRRTVRVRKEVIVAGGALNSPQILMLSGIGPRRHLERHGVDIKVNVPGVGSNLRDHIVVAIIDQYEQEWAALAGCGDVDDHDDPCFEGWDNASDKSGQLYASSPFVAMIKRRYSAGPSDPEVGLVGTPAFVKYFYPGFSKVAGARPHHFFTWLLIKAYPGGRPGTVRLRSNDPTQVPRINKRSLGNNRGGADEIQALIEAIQTARRISSRVPFAHREVFPGAGADLERHIRRNQFGLGHAACSNPIGAKGDRMAVLDGKLRVRGTMNVRVVDASSFPRIPGFVPWAPIAILSEKASWDVLADAG